MTEKYDEGTGLEAALSVVKNTTGQDLVINAPCAAASATAPMYGTEPTEEAGDGLD